MVQLFRHYKELLNPNQELMTQSLKFSKLKFKTIAEVDEKENSVHSPKMEKNGK